MCKGWLQSAQIHIKVIDAIPHEDRSKDLQNLDITKDILPVERALGVQWCVESDTLQFRVELKDQPLTRRGILSTVSSDGADWDDEVP